MSIDESYQSGTGQKPNSMAAKLKSEDPGTVEPGIKYATIPGAQIAYKSCGEGEPLLMCIGFATNMDMWSTRALRLLMQKYRVIIFDYRGMGYSTNTEDSLTIDSMAEDLRALLDELHVEQANILGWSMGGYVAQVLALNHPERVRKLILYATNCGDTATVDPAPEIISILSNPSATPMEMLSTLFTDQWLAANPRPWELLPEASEPINPAAIGLQYMAIQRWLTAGHGSAGRLGELKVPVLVICGDQDKVVPSENSRILADAIESSTLVKVDDSGHGLMYQLPEAFAGYIIDFLDG